MIVTYLEGGLGNLLFQICFTLSKANANNADYYFSNIKENFEIIQSRHNADVSSYKDTILRNINFNQPPRVFLPQISHHCTFDYSDITYEPSCLNFYKGYFQSEKFFPNLDIKSVFSPNEKIEDYIDKKYPFLKSLNCVAIHIRRGDYLSLPLHHPVVGINYYHNALKSLKSFDRILVFSNDLEWCYKHFIDSRAIFIEENDWMSLYIMSKCQNHILANSSFSWWGAKFAESFLEKNVEVIAPKTWFGPAIQDNTKDLIPERWRTI